MGWIRTQLVELTIFAADVKYTMEVGKHLTCHPDETLRPQLLLPLPRGAGHRLFKQIRFNMRSCR